FGILHLGPPRWWWGRGGFRDACGRWRDWLRGLCVLHLKRSSPVLVIMTVVFGGAPGTVDRAVGWWCYSIAIVQYLIIALVTDRDRAIGALARFEQQVDAVRHDLLRDAAGRSACWHEGKFPP